MALAAGPKVGVIMAEKNKKGDAGIWPCRWTVALDFRCFCCLKLRFLDGFTTDCTNTEVQKSKFGMPRLLRSDGELVGCVPPAAFDISKLVDESQS
jgi:hypothetical protein